MRSSRRSLWLMVSLFLSFAQTNILNDTIPATRMGGQGGWTASASSPEFGVEPLVVLLVT